jgi:hypothetical protein
MFKKFTIYGYWAYSFDEKTNTDCTWAAEKTEGYVNLDNVNKIISAPQSPDTLTIFVMHDGREIIIDGHIDEIVEYINK